MIATGVSAPRRGIVLIATMVALFAIANVFLMSQQFGGTMARYVLTVLGGVAAGVGIGAPVRRNELVGLSALDLVCVFLGIFGFVAATSVSLATIVDVSAEDFAEVRLQVFALVLSTIGGVAGCLFIKPRAG